MKKNEVCAVVVTYNRREHVRKCITGILNQREVCCDLIVLDNGSTDGTEEMIRTEFSDCKLIYQNLGENIGCAAAQAKGIKKATLDGYRYIWLMDDDVYPHEDTLCELMKANKELEGEWGILSSVAYWLDGSICEANRQKKTLFRFMDNMDYTKRFVKVCMVSAASMFINVEAVKKVGVPISEYYIYTDDYEFSSRIGREYPLYVVTGSKVTHAMKNNMKVNIVKDTEERLDRYRYLYRNDVHCYKKFGMKGYLYLITKFVYTFCLVLFKEKSKKIEKLRILIKGYRDGMHFNPKIETVDVRKV